MAKAKKKAEPLTEEDMIILRSLNERPQTQEQLERVFDFLEESWINYGIAENVRTGKMAAFIDEDDELKFKLTPEGIIDAERIVGEHAWPN